MGSWLVWKDWETVRWLHQTSWERSWCQLRDAEARYMSSLWCWRPLDPWMSKSNDISCATDIFWQRRWYSFTWWDWPGFIREATGCEGKRGVASTEAAKQMFGPNQDTVELETDATGSLYLPLFVSRVSVMGMIDTGLTVSVVHPSVLAMWSEDSEIPLNSETGRLRLADGSLPPP